MYVAFGQKNIKREKSLERCPICWCADKRSRGSIKPFLVLDHDHATGNARGYICRNCNKGLGFFHENQEELTIAARALAAGQPIRGKGYFWTSAILSRVAVYLQTADLGYPYVNGG